MFLPIFLILLAAGAAAMLAFGTGSDLTRYNSGVEIILLTRRVQWPLAVLSLLSCIVLIGLVIANKRRAWWLIALGPITALFAYRFSLSSDNFFSVVENPPMLTADVVSFVHDDDWIVGVEFAEQAYAYPYASLYSTPVVLQSDREKRMIVLWSPFANAARAYMIDRSIKSRELDIVSMPANALLVYNTRIGQFINGLTGKTPDGELPDGFKAELPVMKTTWKHWRSRHPNSKVLPTSGKVARNPPAAPVLPLYPLPHREWDPPAQTRILVVATTQPVAIPADAITAKPLNLMAGQTPLLVFRDPVTGAARAFDRRIDQDLMPRFELNTDPARKPAVFIDADTSSAWDRNLVIIEGQAELKGRRLKAMDIQDDVYWGVMKYWYPDLEMIKPER